MGESDLHRDMMVNLIEALRHYFAHRDQVYVSGNILLFYEKGKPHVHISPDVLVTLGISNRKRESYKLWEEGKAPDLMIEVTSQSTRWRDVGVKKGLYEALGVREYLLFDPRSDYLEPRFQVYRREGQQFVAVLAPEVRGYDSPLLGLTFRVVEGELRIFETESGLLLLTPTEQARRADEQARRADEEAQRAERYANRLRELGIDPESL